MNSLFHLISWPCKKNIFEATVYLALDSKCGKNLLPDYAMIKQNSEVKKVKIFLIRLMLYHKEKLRWDTRWSA